MTDNYITIDGGTSNTRIALVCNGKVTDKIRLKSGAKDAGGFKKQGLRESIENLLLRNKSAANEIKAVLASGMITSRDGLCEIPHISAPAGIKELHNATVRRYIPEICEIPFAFIPGVKISSDSLEKSEIMRGEETELMGLEEDIADSLVLLPGSHSKCISVSSDSKITDFHTYLTGEMIYAVANATILSKSVNMQCQPSAKYLKIGYEYCAEMGINEALFKTRILDTVLGASENDCFGFFMGAVLYSEINRVIGFPEHRIVVAGKKELKNPTAFLLKEYSEKQVICIDDRLAENAPTMAMLKIYSYNQGENILCG